MVDRRLLLACALMFAGTVVARLPAAWALALSPRGLHCGSATGSLWHGACLDLGLGSWRLAAFEWQVHPLALLRGRLGLRAQAADPRLAGHAELEFMPGGTLSLRDVAAELSLDPALLPVFPAGWSGQAQLALASAELRQGRPAGLRGTLAVQQLRQLRPPLDFGSYTLRFDSPADAQGRQHGQLVDGGGPLALAGEVLLGAGGQYEVSGTVAARTGANPDLARSLELLGPPDASGRRPFSIAGRF